jgi:hypothetical protein
MPYPPGWERLSDAAARVMAAAGVSKEQAQTDICQAIADDAVEIRCKLEKHTTSPIRSKKVLAGRDFEIPTDLKLKHLDWERSRPLKPWFVRPGVLQQRDTGSWAGSNCPGPTLRTFCVPPGS